jgi:hypothetical protein
MLGTFSVLFFAEKSTGPCVNVEPIALEPSLGFNIVI